MRAFSAMSARSSTQPPAAACRARARPTDPAEGVQLREEVDERRDHEPLPRARHPQPRHLRHDVEAPRAGRRHQLAQTVRRVRDVRVRQQQVRGLTRACQPDAVPHRPQLARPARRRLTRRPHRERQPAVPPGQLPGQLPGAVRAPVVHQEDLRPPRIVLRQQRRQTVRQHGGLVPGRYDHTDRRPRRPVPGAAAAARPCARRSPGRAAASTRRPGTRR